jgi:hypothetical protein
MSSPLGTHVPPKWARHYTGGYECSSAGDRRFSALSARLRDGRTIEEAYQLDVKGYRKYGNDWRLGKGKLPIRDLRHEQLWQEYLVLWRQWACENPSLIDELQRLSAGRPLTDKFASTPVSQARALSIILSERTPTIEFTVSL